LEGRGGIDKEHAGGTRIAGGATIGFSKIKITSFLQTSFLRDPYRSSTATNMLTQPSTGSY